MKKEKTIIFLTFTILCILSLSMLGASIEWNTPSKEVVFHPNGGNAYFYTNQSLSLSTISISSDSMTFNTSIFKITSSNRINITMMNINESMIGKENDVLLNFYANTSSGTVTFNIGGMTYGTSYKIYKDDVLHDTVTGNSTGYITFTNDAWSEKEFEVQYGTLGGTPTNWTTLTFGGKADITYANTAPVNSNPVPTDTAIDIILNSSLNITVNDLNADTMNQTFRTNESGSWLAIGWNNNTGNATLSNSTTVFSSYDTKYWWSSNVSDGNGGWDNDTYSFTTESAPPSVSWTTLTFGGKATITELTNNPPTQSNPSPSNNSIGVSNTTVSISLTIEDDGNDFNWTIETSPNVGSNSGNDDTNGSKSCSITNLEHSTQYTWFVNVTDDTQWTRRFYIFTVEDASVPPSLNWTTLSFGGKAEVTTATAPTQDSESPINQSMGQLRNPTLQITVNDTNGDMMDQSFWTNVSGSWLAIGWNNNTGNGVVSNSTTVFNAYLTKYWWSSNVTDGTFWTNNTYHFTTKSESTATNWTTLSFGGKADVQTYTWGNWSSWWNFTYVEIEYSPVLSNPYPVNNSVGVSVNGTHINIDATDGNGDNMRTDVWTNASGSWVQVAGWDVWTSDALNTSRRFFINSGGVGFDDWDIANYSVFAGWQLDGKRCFADGALLFEELNISVTDDWGMTEYGATYWWSVNCTDNTTWTNRTYNFRTIFEGEVVPPTVTTNSATGVEETNATLNGYLNSAGNDGDGCTVWFSYGTTTGYGTNTTNQTEMYTGDSFNVGISGLNAGTLYHYRAVANNSNSTVYGNDIAFLTKPDVTTNLVVNNGYSPSVLNISWTKGIGSNHTYIERNTLSSWSRGDGTLLYNDTGTHYNDTGLSMNTLYYYQSWSYTNWTYNPTVHRWSDSYASGSNTTDNVDPPYNGNSNYDINNFKVNLTWSRGNHSDREIVVQNNNSYPTSPTDGWVRQNSTNTYANFSVTYNAYFTVWSCNTTSGYYSSTGLNIPWGVLQLNVFDENSPWVEIENYIVFISDESGQVTYYAINQSNPVVLDYNGIPYGVNTIIQISHSSYETRINYFDLYLNEYNSFNFYLPPIEIIVDPDPDPNGDVDCILRSFIDSISVSSHTVDLVISLTYFLEDLIQVEVYNSSLFGTYGGWIVVANNYVDYNATRVIISNSVLDEDSSMARVSYYFESCDPSFIYPALYYIRVVESYETSYGITDRSVESVKVLFQKYMNTTNSYENISILLTGANGFVNLYLIPETLYKIILQKDGYVTKNVSYFPPSPNEFGQTTEKVLRIISLDEVVDDDITILMETVVVAPYNTTAFSIYYLNLNENTSYLNFSIYDGSTLLFTYNVSVDSNDVIWYFNFSSYDLNSDILTLVVNSTKIDGSYHVFVRYFNIQEASEMGMPSSAPIAAIFSIAICLFGLTIAHPKKVFGVVGLVVMIVAIAITAFTQQTWYIHLIQAAELLLLIFILLTFKEEGVHAI